MKNINSNIMIIGNGIVGSATALQLKTRHPDLSVLLIDKELDCAQHQTGHNSGVVHAGVYYQPGSLKADFCKRGAILTREFCIQHNLPYEQCGKLLVATNELELERMEGLRERCHENSISVHVLSARELKQKEPNVVGRGALLVPGTAITDYPAITRRMISTFRDLGGETLFGSEVHDIEEHSQYIRVVTGEHAVETSYLVVCGGLMADRLARLMEIDIDFQIVPFRGEYYQLRKGLQNIVKQLIYPIPDPKLPFLGVHLTPMVDGSLTVGPNAVLGWKREGYGRINVNGPDILEMFAFPGFWKVVSTNLSSGIREMIDSLYMPGYLKRVRKYCPSITSADLHPYPAGIRAQAVMSDGSLVHDFLFAESNRSLHVCNAPSPAATSAIPIGEYLCNKASEKFGLGL
jgi:L-2-hydroxyglutarate oxidase